MIRWLIQSVADHPDLAEGRPSPGLLTPAELAHYQALLGPRRRRDWLLGRWTAKRLVQTHIAATDGYTPALDSFTIAYFDSGAPYIASQRPALRGACTGGEVPLSLTISHSHGYAFCALTARRAQDARVGADIELVEPRPPSFVEEFFTTAEVTNIDIAPPYLRDLLITATWSAKEAALKASHLALRADPRSFECIVPHARPRHWIPLRVTVNSPASTIGQLRVWWRVIENCLRPGTSFVLTLAAYGTTLQQHCALNEECLFTRQQTI